MIIKRRVKFIWGASGVIRGRWYLGLLGLYNRREGMREDGLVISVRGALLWGAVMVGLGWVALATAGFWIWQRNPYTLLTYTDALLYPLRQAEIAEKKGQATIAQGLDLARAGRWHEAANLLRYGLARFPRDFRARLTLAEYYQLTNQRTLAMSTLTDGLADEYPGRRYMDAVLNLAAQGEDFDAVAELCARFLPAVKRDGPLADHWWLLERRYGALVAAERHAEALAMAESESPGDSRDEHRVMSLLALGRQAEAIAVLAEWRTRPGADLKVVSRLEVRAFRETGQYREMEGALAELRQRSPGEPGPLAYAVVQQAMAKRDEAASAALDDYIFRFGGSAENLALVAGPLAELGNLALLERCVAAARERGFPLARFQVLLIETHLRRSEWKPARHELDALPPATAKDGAGKLWREWLGLLIDATQNPAEPAQQALTEFLRGRAWALPLFRQSVEALLRAGRLETARDVLDHAMHAFPASKWLRANAAEVKLRLLARTPALPPESTGAEAPVSAEKIFVQRLEYLLKAQQWTEASRHITQALSLEPVPGWLEGRDAMIRLAQVRIAQAQGDLREMTAAARLFLNGEMARAQELHEVARSAFAEGDRTGAVALAREIVRRTPGFAAAQRSLREWDEAEAAPVGPEKKEAVPLPHEREALVAELQARRAAGDVPGMLAAARLLLTGDQARASRAVELARAWFRAGDRNAAEFLVREVMRRHNEFPPARRLLNEMNPADAGKK